MTTVQWPRYWYNYPIILCGIALQYIWALALITDPTAINATAVNALAPYFHRHSGPFNLTDFDFAPIRWAMILVLLATASLSFLAFSLPRKLHTVLSLIPQQFILLLSAGTIIRSIYLGQFADGTVRSPAFIFADQSPVLLLTVFHTWAVILILLHGTDSH